MNLNFNFTGKTLLREWWKIIRDNLQTIQTRFIGHRTAAEIDHPDKSVKQKHIGDYAVGTQQLAQYAVTKAKIYPGAVETAHIKDGNVTKAKLSQDLLDLMEELQSYSQTITLTFQDFEKSDALGLYCGEQSAIAVEDGWVYLKSGQDAVQSGGTYGDYMSETYYFSGLGSVSGTAYSQKPIERLMIQTSLGFTSGGVELGGSQGISIYRVTDNMNFIDHEYGEEIPASEYTVVTQRDDYLEVVFTKPITLSELSVAADIAVDAFFVDFDSNDNPIPIEAYPGMSFKAIVKNDNPLDTELSGTSSNGVENRAVTAGIKAAADEIKSSLYGDTIKYTIIAPKEIPALDDDNSITIDTSKIKVFKEGKDISGNWDICEHTFSIDTISDNYIYMMYNANDGIIQLLMPDEELIEGEYADGRLVVLLYFYGSYNSSDFSFDGYYGSENADSTGKTYTVITGNTAQKSISDLNGHISFLSAVNTNTDSIATLRNEISGIDLAILSLQGTLGTLTSELDALNGEEQS